MTATKESFGVANADPAREGGCGCAKSPTGAATFAGSRKAALLLGLLRREMNGAVADSMTARGVVYGVNYGVSAAAIRRIAAGFAPDHQLAMELYRSDVRELIIASLFIADPRMVDLEQFSFWEEGVTGSEEAEYLAFALMARTSLVWEAFMRWSESEQMLLRYLAAMTLLRALALQSDTSRWDMARIGAFVASSAASSDRMLQTAALNLGERLGLAF
ncbi:hypothetical protein FACS1894159_08850 [Bacteroidia bacterium]|nr:hypothetical protein FACS1894159_08850 [Bacteroidia bacterium]